MTYLHQVAKVKTLWTRACRFDAVPPDSNFVVFTPDNPYRADLNRETGRLLAMRSERAVARYAATVTR